MATHQETEEAKRRAASEDKAQQPQRVNPTTRWTPGVRPSGSGLGSGV